MLRVELKWLSYAMPVDETQTECPQLFASLMVEHSSARRFTRSLSFPSLIQLILGVSLGPSIVDEKSVQISIT